MLLCCFEVRLKTISKAILLHFGFLYQTRSRCIFFFFLATILFSFGFFGQLLGLLMLANLAFNLIMLWRHPGLEQALRDEVERELGDLLRGNQAFSTMIQNTGKEMIMKNPGEH